MRMFLALALLVASILVAMWSLSYYNHTTVCMEPHGQRWANVVVVPCDRNEQ